MHKLAGEEKAALLLTAADDDDEDHELMNSSSQIDHDNFPIVAKRPKTYQRHHTPSTHPVLCFTLILAAFILGCVSGVVILLYRMSQEAQPVKSTSSPITTNVDLTIQTKLFQSITKTNFLNLNRSIESDNDASANKLHEQWKSLSSTFTRVNKLSYEITLAKYASSSSSQWNGIQLLDGNNDKELLKVDRLSTENFLSFSSLVKSGTINANSIYYVNYGRQEDFAYLFKNRIRFETNEKSIVFMRRKQTIISQTEQIHQAIYYQFGALVLFDDNQNQQTTTTNYRQGFFEEWARQPGVKERENYLDGIRNDKDHSIALLILSYDDVQRIFGSLQPDSNSWLTCPTEWHNRPTPLKVGGGLSTMKLRLVVNTQNVNIQLPVVMALIRGSMDPDHFVMIGYQLGATQQNRIVNEVIQAYGTQIKNGWNPRRSILFCAWSGLDYDHYTIRRWLLDNYRLVDRNLISYVDLGNGIIGNSTLNLHGSSLLHQIAHRAADSVASPLIHNHTCHHRQKPTTAVSQEENHHHDHGRRRRDGDHEHHMETNEEEEVKCEPHKLLDEWIRASNNQIGINKSLSIVQNIDMDSSASIFQLQHGIPSMIIEMTDEQALTNDTFYVRKSSPVFDPVIQPEVYVAYTQFISEVIRQLVDEPLIPFSLTNYADQIDKQVTEYLVHYERAYGSLGTHLGDQGEFSKTLNDLTKAIRQIQLRIDQTSKNDYIRLQSFNKQLIELERLFITDNQLRQVNPTDEIYKHILIGPAFGLTKTSVPFPLLSNILFNIPGDPPSELCDASKLIWSKLKEHIHLITRTLNGPDGLFTKDK